MGGIGEWEIGRMQEWNVWIAANGELFKGVPKNRHVVKFNYFIVTYSENDTD